VTFDQRNQQVGTQYNAAGDIHFHQPPVLDARQKRDRRTMLEKVRVTWVQGVLEKSLYKEVLIALNMEERPDAVDRPWGMVRREYDRSESLPPGTRIADVFKDAGGELLILGAPGSGKTTTLLELARDLILQAEQDDSMPMPVVFNLSSWARERKALDVWLVEELNTGYGVTRKLGREWVADDLILLMLDGLDEVQAEHRNACVAAINAFRSMHGMARIVACSRVADYEALTAPLKLQTAVQVQTLTAEQIDAYLVRAELEALRTLLQADTVLQEMLETPLMLSILTLAYQGAPIDELPVMESIAEQRSRVFAAYVRRMLQRRGSDRYAPQRVVRWLSWLAGQMVHESQSVYFIENMQPSWIPQYKERIYRNNLVLLLWLVHGLGNVLAMGPAFGLVAGVFGGLVCGLEYGLLFGLGKGLVTIKPTEMLAWSWREARRGLISGLVIGLTFGLVYELVKGLVNGLVKGPVGVLVEVLAIGLLMGLIVGVANGLRNGMLTTKNSPNESIWRSGMNAVMVLLLWLVIGLILGLVSGTVIQPIYELAVGPTYVPIAVLSIGLVLGLRAGVTYGGIAVLQHIVLRLMLYRAGLLPLKLALFLNSCADCILLRKVGGGYIFIHRSLLEYFASLTSDEQTHLVEGIKTAPTKSR
jgi:hypothetical protein